MGEELGPKAFADLEAELAVWKARAEAAEAAVARWETRQNRSLWRILVVLDQLRVRVAPPGTRREVGARKVARAATRGLTVLGRSQSSARGPTPRGWKAALFVADEDGSHTRYRCDHQSEQLRVLGASSDVVQSDDVDLVRIVDHYDCFILHRVRWSDDVAAFFDRAREANKRVIFETDDLIFEPELFRSFAFLDRRTEDARSSWIKKLLRYRRTLQACDGAIVSTDPLLRHTREHNDRVEVVYNAVSEEMLHLADEALVRAHPSAKSEVTIAYLSGTDTHGRDFLQAADAVLFALEQYPQVGFLAVGAVDLDSRFDRFAKRVRKAPIQPWRALPELLSRADINLAPLEGGNPFTECKSCVKYLEAGLLRVPTIASARPDFVRAIDDGRTGLLAETPTEWRDALRRMIESPPLRRAIGAAAYDDVRRHHTSKARAKLLEHAIMRLTCAEQREAL